LGVVFSIFVFTGWEGLPSLAEETKDPRRNIARGTIGAVALWAVLLVFCTWAFLIGAGTGNIAGIVKSGGLPPLDLAHHAWGGAWVILLLAILNSSIAVFIVTVNVSARMWYGMARSRVLPVSLTKLHPKHKTPTNAIYVELGVTLIALAVAAIFGPANTFAVYSLMITFGLIVVYCMLNLGVVRYYAFGPGRPHFNVWLHAVAPVLSSAALLVVGYKSAVPLPPAPAKYAPIVIAVWVALGVLVLLAMRMRGQEAWLSRAGETMDEAPEPLSPTALEAATAGEPRI
jgi:amino acid transporter